MTVAFVIYPQTSHQESLDSPEIMPLHTCIVIRPETTSGLKNQPGSWQSIRRALAHGSLNQPTGATVKTV
jgi:hypothetical protein